MTTLKGISKRLNKLNSVAKYRRADESITDLTGKGLSLLPRGVCLCSIIFVRYNNRK